MNERFFEALKLAIEAHDGQRDKGGHPYILHPVTVASYLNGDDEKVLAILHDTVEDTSVTLEEVRDRFGSRIADALECMTHKDGENYNDYISRVMTNSLAERVKLADLRHNMDLSRIGNPTEKDIARQKKYTEAMYRIALDLVS